MTYCFCLTLSIECCKIMLAICDEFALAFHMKFKSSKTVALRVGSTYNHVQCSPLILAKS